ncbi:MAG TPA: hypothetical protein VK466_05290 [Terriglobales bacterium]|nr:hypothetical protein [Terriglobales bacterium]
MSSEQNPHEPLVERVLVGFDLTAEHHVAHCAPCQTERQKLEEALQQFGAANREYASRSEDFWDKQAAQIQQKRRESSNRARVVGALAPALAMLLFVGVFLVSQSPHVEPSAQTVPAVQTDSDHELLVAVERAVESDTPQALAPVAWMEEENDGSTSLPARSNQKESRSHEN